jgi:PAS domain S-box-containing protein
VSGPEDLSRVDLSPVLKRRIRDAVLAELVAGGIDRFEIDGVARRAGVEPAWIRALWHDRRVLLMDVMLDRSAPVTPSPDTGSLRTDLEAGARVVIALSEEPEQRLIFRRMLPGGADSDLAEMSLDLWNARFRGSAEMLERARRRQQLRDGVDPETAVRIFSAALVSDCIFNDAPIRNEYVDQLIDIFLHGVLGAGGRDRPWGDVDQLARLRSSGADASAADLALEVAERVVVLTRAWADSLLDPVVMMETVRDDQGRVVDFLYRDVNRAACKEMDLTRAEMVGRSVFDISPYFGSSGLVDVYAGCAESGEPVVLNDYRYQHFDEQRRVDIRATYAGAEMIAVTWRVVTERYEAAQRDKRYRKLMDFSPIPVGVTTADGHFVSVNQAMASMVGYDIQTLLTMRWHDVTAPDLLPREIDMVAQMLAGARETYRTVKQYRHADGHLFDAELLLSCIRDENGEVENLIAQIIDQSGR